MLKKNTLNATKRINIYMVSWPSGLRRTPGKCVGGNPSRVRIPPKPPFINTKALL